MMNEIIREELREMGTEELKELKGEVERLIFLSKPMEFKFKDNMKGGIK